MDGRRAEAVPKPKNQKIKLLALMEIFQKYTDDDNHLSVPELLSLLEKEYDVIAERRTLYEDIACLNNFGFQILSPLKRDPKTIKYRHADRLLDIWELRMLITAVQSSKHISEEKANELITKFLTLHSIHQTRGIHAKMTVPNRADLDSYALLHNLDAIQRAIAEDRQVSFSYYQLNYEGKRDVRRGGQVCQISPLALLYAGEIYYLIGQEPNDKKTTPYRVERIENVCVLDIPRTEQKGRTDKLLSDLTKCPFAIYGGEVKRVKLRFSNELVDVAFDGLGRGIKLKADGEAHFTVSMNIAVNDRFFGWLVGLGNAVLIVSPKGVADRYIGHLEAVRGLYNDK